MGRQLLSDANRPAQPRAGVTDLGLRPCCPPTWCWRCLCDLCAVAAAPWPFPRVPDVSLACGGHCLAVRVDPSPVHIMSSLGRAGRGQGCMVAPSLPTETEAEEGAELLIPSPHPSAPHPGPRGPSCQLDCCQGPQRPHRTAAQATQALAQLHTDLHTY